MRQDEQHLNLLSIFHYIVAGITALFSSMFLIHVAMGIAMVCGALEGEEPPPPFFGWIFIFIGAVLVSAGWTLAGFMIAAGRKLRRHTSRTFCLVVAGCECMLMPYGTVLGVFTIVVLMKDSVRSLFSVHEDGAGVDLA